MNPQFSEIWVYLSASPLLGLSMTLLAYQGAFWLYQRSGQNPLANPVLIAVSLLVLFLTLTATRYETYFAGMKPTSLAPSSSISCSDRPQWRSPFLSTPSSNGSGRCCYP